jgi:hypothetical protein
LLVVAASPQLTHLPAVANQYVPVWQTHFDAIPPLLVPPAGQAKQILPAASLGGKYW